MSIEFSTHTNKMDEERRLYEAMKDLPDFECFPIPQSWFKRFNIQPRNPVSVKEYIHSNYAMEMSLKPKDLPPIIIDKPQQDGKLVEMVKVDEPVVEVISRPFELKEGEMFPAILPFLKDPLPEAQSPHQEDTQSDTESLASAHTQEQTDETSEQ